MSSGMHYGLVSEYEKNWFIEIALLTILMLIYIKLTYSQ